MLHQAQVGMAMMDFNPGFRPTLLLVDDDVHQLELRALTLKTIGFTVLSAASPAAAISTLAYAGCKVDVAVLDYDMPMMNGCVLADRLRVSYPDLKIILHSGAIAIPDEEIRRVDVFVPKANGIQSLVAHIAALTWDGTPSAQALGREAHAGSAGEHSF